MDLEAATPCLDRQQRQYLKLGCAGTCCASFIFLVVVLIASYTTLGPEDQLVIYTAFDKEVINGPYAGMQSCFLRKELRKAQRLTERQYAVVKHQKKGTLEHKEGPDLVFLGAWEEIQAVKDKIVLQKLDYIRLIDELTGEESVEIGPKTLTPGPLQTYPQGVESAVVVNDATSVLLLDKTRGSRSLVTDKGPFRPAPYQEILEVRQALAVKPLEYAIVTDIRNGQVTHRPGPMQLKLGAYETMNGTKSKVVLERDEFIRLVDKKSGAERVVVGPDTIIPDPAERSDNMIEKARFLGGDSAVLVLNKTSGLQRLISEKGTFAPAPYEIILEERSLIRVLPHEAVVVRDHTGALHVKRGDTNSGGNPGEVGSAFFLQPHHELLALEWSTYGASGSVNGSSTELVTRIDLRARKSAFKYEVRTSDNVKLRLEGQIFWQINNVDKMVAQTSDPEGDVWLHARSALIQAVSKATLSEFMANFNNITMESFKAQAKDGFYDDRGVVVQDLELTRFECVDQATADVLQQIIQETTNRINKLQAAQSANEVKAAALSAEITLEQQKGDLIRQQAANARLEAETEGEAAGLRSVKGAAVFIEGLNSSIPDVNQRLELYKLHETLKGRNKDTAHLSGGNAKLYLTPESMNLRLDMTEANGRRLDELTEL
eukprot:TRINITY_DN48024_c0_g1_i1.p1 TRINITY_DN48024_c0_g1~~TRINITY_DN48024_c0_g1_i1.p1  ORF type:complete len:683 (-),score=155.41 TRINITY_DN48024_c0_g1_i1:142-2121(-)